MRASRLASVLVILMVMSFAGAAPASSGVVFELETTYYFGSETRVEHSEVSVLKPNLKMGVLSVESLSGAKTLDEMVYRGDRKQMLVIQHDEKAYMMMDRETMEKMFAVYPGSPVGVGDSWNAEYVLTAGFPMIVSNTWKVKSIVGDKVTIEVESTIQPNMTSTLPQFGGMNIAYDIQGTQNGHIVMDTLTGWLWEGEMKQQLDGMMSMSGGMFGSEGMKWPIQMESIVKIETIE